MDKMLFAFILILGTQITRFLPIFIPMQKLKFLNDGFFASFLPILIFSGLIILSFLSTTNEFELFSKILASISTTTIYLITKKETESIICGTAIYLLLLN